MLAVVLKIILDYIIYIYNKNNIKLNNKNIN